VHWHEALELLYFTKGKAVTACNLQEYEVKKGTIVLINGNELHTGIVSEQDSVFYCIQFDPNFFHNLIGDQYVLFQNIIQDEDCTKLLDSLIALHLEKTTTRSIVESKKLAYEFFILLTERYTKNILGEEDYKKQFKKLDTFHHIIDYLDKNLFAVKTLNQLENEFNYSYNYLSAVFSKTTNFSINEYFIKLKMEKAMKLLQEGNSVTAVSEKLNYSSIHNFSRAFKKYFGTNAKDVYKN
jgi:AraC-like DNA-binding protein